MYKVSLFGVDIEIDSAVEVLKLIDYCEIDTPKRRYWRKYYWNNREKILEGRKKNKSPKELQASPIISHNE